MNRLLLLTRTILIGLSFLGIMQSTITLADTQTTISTENMRVVLPPPVATSTSAYGIIKNTGKKADTLLSISTNAGMIMLHKTDIKGGMAQMNHVDKTVIQPGEELILKPMSYHLMLMNINHDIIKENGKVLITLVFKNAGIVKLTVPVKSD